VERERQPLAVGRAQPGEVERVVPARLTALVRGVAASGEQTGNRKRRTYGRKYSVRSTSAGLSSENFRSTQRPDAARRSRERRPSPSSKANGSTQME
jgi:hypothetical protein